MMIVCSSCLGRMLFFWVSLWMLMTFLRLGLSGQVLLRLRLLMSIGSLVVLHPIEVWFLGVGRVGSVLSDLVGIRFGRCVVVLLMRMMLLTFSCAAILLLLPCLTEKA